MSQAGILNRGVFPPGSVVETLTGNSGGPVGPDGANNINVVGDGTTVDVAGNPGTNTLTISFIGSVGVETLTTDDGHVVTPTAGNIDIHGAHGLNTTGTIGPNDVTIAINNAITLGDLAVLPANANAVSLTTGDLNVAAGNIKLPFTDNVNYPGHFGVVMMGGPGLFFLHAAGPVNGAVGPNNVWLGGGAGSFGVTGSFNVGIGRQAMQNITSGANNIGIGILACGSTNTGSDNIAIGSDSLVDALGASDQNIAIGSHALDGPTAPIGNIAIGHMAGSSYTTSEEYNILIGSTGVVGDNNTIRIGTAGTHDSCFITGIDGVDLGNIVNVVTEDNNQLGTAMITGSGGITITGSSNEINIDGSGVGSSIILTGNSGTATGPAINVLASTAEGTSLITGDNVSTLTLTFTDADFNVVLGTSAFESTHTPAVAVANTGLGVANLNAVTTASGNVAVGFNAAASLLSGINNTIVGTNAMGSSTSAATNAAFGASALTALLSGSGNVALGTGAGSNYAGAESDNILIGSLGVLAESGKIRIGTNGTQTAAFIAGIDGVNVGSVATVVTEASDQLGTAVITAGTGITVTPAANLITIAATGTSTLTVTSVNHAASPYTVLSTDSFLSVDVSGGVVSILLPNAPATGRVYYIKDAAGLAATSNITVTTVGGAVNIDGATSFVMNTAYESINVIFDGSAYEVF